MKSAANLGMSGASDAVQSELFERPAFSPVLPSHASLAAAAADMLLKGREITQCDFLAATRSWRLAAYIFELKQLGWPIEKEETQAPTADHPDRYIAKYRLPQWALKRGVA